ncbi:MAG: putative toxin-antitoxin system toxin component, PIN family [Verrucomicrobiota bacterium]|jgi:putative PIN family toxin of toxin-antitoxin system
MIRAVLDCGVLVSAIGWGGNARSCLDLAASGQVSLFVTDEIWKEYADRIPAIVAAEQRDVDAQPVLAWLLTIAQFVQPAPLGKPRSRDTRDDPYLACALQAGADVIVSNDRDLLVLGKPFGVAILTPIQFLKFVRGATGN